MKRILKKKALKCFSDDELVAELKKRGYEVVKWGDSVVWDEACTEWGAIPEWRDAPEWGK